MRRFVFAAVLAAGLASNATACDGARFPRLAKLFAQRPVAQRPVVKVATAVTQAPVRVFQFFAAPLRPTCVGGNCR